MKHFLFFFLFIPIFAFSQVPQGVGYQGVATDANGIELVNQSISIRASIISASPTGTIEWQETHTTSTDTFGLFTLTIGQGTSTGNGAQTIFADISWGANTHFLKIEMDVNGGTNYSHMGTNQMMSVPYALYAENANIDYDSIATILSNDSTFINNFSFGGNMVFGNMEDPNINLFYSNPSYNSYYSDTIQAQEDGFLMIFIPNSNGTSSLSVKVSDSSSFLSANTIEYSISETQSYNWSDALTIPIKKNNFYLVNRYFMYNVLLKWLPIVSGGSSSTSIDSTYIDSLVQFYSSGNGGGCNSHFPDGFGGESIIWWFNSQGDFTVPAGKTFYMLRETWWDGSVVVNGTTTTMGVPGGQPLIIPENSIITDANTDGGFSGFLIDKTVESIIWWFNTQGDFTVPAGKTFYMFRETWWDGSVVVNGTTTTMGVPGGQHLIIPENSIIADANADGGFSGYLVDNNHFADCSGGGSSSSGGSNNSGGGSGCDYQFPEGLNGEPITSSCTDISPFVVPINKRLVLLSTNTTTIINGFQFSDVNYGEVMILDSGDSLSASTSSVLHFNAFLIEATPSINFITSSCTDISPFVVPINKRLVLLSTNTTTIINGFQFSDVNYGEVMILDSGDSLSASTSSVLHFNGYLADENYFAGCGGGGGSSSSLDSLTIVSMIDNALTNTVAIGVGDYYGGGVVIDIYQPGETGYISGETHGVIAYHDNNILIPWGCAGITTGINNLGIGQGIVNTQDLVNTCSEANFAAKFCNDLVVGIYDDWYLPNYAEFVAYMDQNVWNTWNIYSVWVSEEYDPNILSFGGNNCSGGICNSNLNAYIAIDFSNIPGFSRYIMGKDLINGTTGGTPHTIAFRQF